MTSTDLIAAVALFLVFLFTILRTEILNPRLDWTPTAPYIERLAWDVLAVSAGLRGWMIWTDVAQASGSEATMAAAMAAVAFIGMCKVFGRAFLPRVYRWLFGEWSW